MRANVDSLSFSFTSSLSLRATSYPTMIRRENKRPFTERRKEKKDKNIIASELEDTRTISSHVSNSVTETAPNPVA